MDTIMSYLETMFSKIPKTAETERIKQDLQLNMEEKYQELIAAGETENEAVGTVISEFGNIDELMDELGYEVSGEEQNTLTNQEIDGFLSENKYHGKMTGIGVGLILLGVSIFMLINGLVFESGSSSRLLQVSGLVPLLILIAIAVGIFIVSDHRMKPFKTVLRNYQLTPDQAQRLEQQAGDFRPRNTKAIVLGVTLFILAPLILIIMSVIDRSYAQYGVSILLVLVAIGVYIIIYYGKQNTAYEKLLDQEDYKLKEKYQDDDKVVSAVAALIFPLATATFLVTGLIFNQWQYNWLIFPVTGLLFAGFSGFRAEFKDK